MSDTSTWLARAQAVADEGRERVNEMQRLGSRIESALCDASFNERVGERIREARIARGYDRDGLAMTLNVTEDDLIAIEAGEAAVYALTLWRVAMCCRVTSDELLHGRDDAEDEGPRFEGGAPVVPHEDEVEGGEDGDDLPPPAVFERGDPDTAGPYVGLFDDEGGLMLDVVVDGSDCHLQPEAARELHRYLGEVLDFAATYKPGAR